jgi:predicted GTPase
VCTTEQMNLVDTPGTNVILQRQQQLTEEYVPRADLILFVLSSDRPLTDSEVRIVSVLLCLTFTYLIL